MKKFALLIILCAFAFGGFAQAEVKEIKIGGTIDLDMLWRNNMEDFDNNKKDQPAYAELEIILPILATFTDNVSARITLEDQTAAADGVDRENIGVGIDEAYVTVNEFLWEQLTFQIGKMPLNYPVRPTCGYRCLHRNTTWILGNDYFDPLGVLFSIKAGNNWKIDTFWYKLDEFSKRGTNARPQHAGSETGNSSDFDLYGSVIDYSWNEVDVIRGMLLYWHDDAMNSRVRNSAGNLQAANRHVFEASIGTNLYFFDKSLEYYGVLGYQNGNYDKPADLDVDAFGCYTGLEYTFKHDLKPYIGVEFMYVEGDSDDEAQWQNFGANGFTTALIFENQYQDHAPFEDGGYWRASGVGGLKALPHHMNLDFAISYLQDTDDSADNAAGDQIGWEADAIWGYAYTSDLKFELGFGWFFVNEDYAKNGGARGQNGFNPNAPHDDAWLLVFNTTINF